MTPQATVNQVLAEGSAACARGDYDEAVELFERGISIASETWGAESAQLVHLLLGLSRALDKGGLEDRQALETTVLPFQERARSLAEKHSKIYAAELSRIIATVAHTLKRIGRLDDAVAGFEASIAASQRHSGNTWNTAHQLFNLAALLLKMKRPAAALPYLHRVREIEASSRPERPNWLTVAHIGRCLLDLERGNEALPYLELALHLLEGRQHKNGDTDEVRAWIAEAQEGGS